MNRTLGDAFTLVMDGRRQISADGYIDMCTLASEFEARSGNALILDALERLGNRTGVMRDPTCREAFKTAKRILEKRIREEPAGRSGP